MASYADYYSGRQAGSQLSPYMPLPQGGLNPPRAGQRGAVNAFGPASFNASQLNQMMMRRRGIGGIVRRGIGQAGAQRPVDPAMGGWQGIELYGMAPRYNQPAMGLPMMAKGAQRELTFTRPRRSYV